MAKTTISDLKSTPTFIDLDFKLQRDRYGNIIKHSDTESVRQSIKMILSTYPGERLMLPEFGSRLRDILFEPISNITTSQIRREIKTAVERWDDRVVINTIDVIPDHDRNQYKIFVVFQISGSNRTEEFNGTLRSLAG